MPSALDIIWVLRAGRCPASPEEAQAMVATLVTALGSDEPCPLTHIALERLFVRLHALEVAAALPLLLGTLQAGGSAGAAAAHVLFTTLTDAPESAGIALVVCNTPGVLPYLVRALCNPNTTGAAASVLGAIANADSELVQRVAGTDGALEGLVRCFGSPTPARFCA
ncbi:MAG: hypothetical protein J3K34DRAFT_413690 [Monoraphidium minutum]|nr:MAG: hypothetical protein J3K34DRAFT_413690 [Monoraphidium minutum]